MSSETTDPATEGWGAPAPPDDNSPAGLADFFGDEAMLSWHEARDMPPGPERSAEIERGALAAQLGAYWVLRAKFGPPV